MSSVVEKPESVNLNELSLEDINNRLHRILSIVKEPFINGIGSTEKFLNKEVMQTDELKAMHKSNIELGEKVLGIIMGLDWVEHFRNATINKYRSEARKEETKFEFKSDKVSMFSLDKYTFEQKVSILMSIREYVHSKYEEGFLKLELHDNGKDENLLAPGEHEYYSSMRNLSGMIIPYSDNGTFLFNWRKSLIQEYRSSERDPDDFF